MFMKNFLYPGFICFLVFLTSTKSSLFNTYQWMDLSSSSLAGVQAELTNWIITATGSATYTLCSNSYYAGGPGVMNPTGVFMQRTYYLPVHNMVYYSIYIMLWDYWNATDYLSIKFDSTEIQLKDFVHDYTDFGTNACGETGRRGAFITLVGKIVHNASSLPVQIISNTNAPSTEKSFGIRFIELLFSNNNRVETQQMCALTPISLLNNYKCKCASNQYEDASGVCQPCSPYCMHCFGPSSSECYKCADYRYYNGTDCIQCDPSCNICNKHGPNGCVWCLSTQFLLANMCVADCDPPLTYTSSIYCSYPCAANKILYPDGSCRDTCPPPLISFSKYTFPFCKSPCSTTGEKIFYDGSCSSVSSCPYPLVLKTYGPLQICDRPCPVGEIAYDDGSCSDPSVCIPPLIKQIYGDIEVCKTSCLNPAEFLDWNSNCRSACPLPFQQQMANSLKVCQLPLCGAQPCQYCQTNNDCPAHSYCYKTTTDGVCISYITYTLEAELLRTIMNGYVIRVGVSPLEGLPEGGDYDTLIMKAELNTNYNATIQKISKGTFLVTLTILEELDQDTFSVHFTYSPINLNLHSDLNLASIIFISPALQQAAQIVQTSSYVSFGIMMVNILGYAMTGGLSALWAFLPENQYTFYLLYLNVDYPYHTKIYFRSLSNYDLLLQSNQGQNDDASIDKQVKRSLPIRFLEEQYSISFLQNAGQTIALIVGILVALLVVSFIFKKLSLPRRSYLAHKILKLIRRILKWNGLVRQFLAYSLPLMLASFVQIYGSIFGKQMLFLSTITAVALCLAFVYGFKVTYQVLNSIPSDPYERVIYTEWYGTLWEGLELNTNTRYYYWLTALRGVIFVYVAVFLDICPLAQITLLILCQCGIVSLFIRNYRVHQVFEVKGLNIVTLFQEGLILAMKLMIFALLIMSYGNKVKDNIMIIMGWLIIAPGVVSQVIQSLYSIICQIAERKKIIDKIKQIYKDSCLKKNKKRNKVKKVHIRLDKMKDTNT